MQDLWKLCVETGIVLQHAVVQQIGRVLVVPGAGFEGYASVWKGVDCALHMMIPALGTVMSLRSLLLHVFVGPCTAGDVLIASSGF